MSLMTKIVIIVLCLSLCGTGVFIGSTVREKTEPQRMNAIPVENRDVVRHIWIQV
jgi:uncharacterized protein YneF (UPF0154 family)